MAASLQLVELRKLIGGVENLHAHETLAAPSVPAGVPRGTLVELLGSHKIEWLLLFLKQHTNFKIFWIEQKQSLLPTAIQQRGVDLSRITFATLASDSILLVRKVIQSQLYDVIISPHDFSEIKTLKAFQLFTEKANCTLFLLSKERPSGAWPISTVLEIQRSCPLQNQAPDIEISSLKLLSEPTQNFISSEPLPHSSFEVIIHKQKYREES